MNTTRPTDRTALLTAALADADASRRLRAALAAGTHDDPALLDVLVARCAVEPDFFVRDMLTWALTRRPAEVTVPRLLAELGSGRAQARSQALHTLSKIGDGRAWPAVAGAIHDTDDDVARAAWRASVVVVPDDEKASLAAGLAEELGRGDAEVRRSLGRALSVLGDDAAAALACARAHPDPRVRAHAAATERLRLDPDSAFDEDVEEARRVAALGPHG